MISIICVILQLNYDHKYDEITKKCSLEIAEEMCINEATEITPIELSCNKISEITNQKISAKFTHLENINIHKNNFVNNIRKEMQYELHKFETHNEKNRENEYTIITKNYLNNETLNNEIQCFFCKNTFKTEEIFENHKILCNKEKTIIQKDKGTNNNTNDKESCNINLMNFQFIKTCNICQKHFETEKDFIEHKISYCKILSQNYQNPSKENKESYDNYNDSCNIKSTPPMETNKKCGHCNLIYNTKKELLNHIMECHQGQLLFRCIICDRNFEKWSSLDIHEATHRIDKPYLCDLCGKSFKHSNNLRGHKRIHLDDSRKKRHICDICGKAYRSR